MLFEGISKVMGMAVSDIFNTKVLDDEAEKDRAPLVAPMNRNGGAFIVAMLG